MPRFSHPPAEPTAALLRDVRVLTMAEGDRAAHEGWSVLVRDGVIVEVGPSVQAPPGATIIDGEGRTLLPGLVDMHVHVWDETELLAYLAHGVTTVRNMSGMPLHLELAARIEAGEIEGPRLLTTGPILNSPGPNQQLNHQLVSDAAEAREAVKQQHAQGYRHLKVYSNLTREAYEAVVAEAEARGMTITGHSPEGVRAEGVPLERAFEVGFDEVLDDGFVTLEHMETIVWHALADELDEVKLRALAREIAAAGVPVDPTLIAHHALQKMAETDGAWARRPESGLLNPVLVAYEAEHYATWAAQDPDLRRGHDAFFARATAIFHEEGVRLVAGTDAGIFTNIPGSAMTRELELLVAAGIPEIDVLAIATTNGAAVLGLGDTVGRVAPGFRAELILVDGDPLSDISVVEHPVGLMRGDSWLDADDLARLHDAAGRHDPGRTQANLEAGLAAQRLDAEPESGATVEP
ncbi:MAG: amidohydrolase family protein [Myxococcales bacterium]|nr:amidohydrolase family protein [Myxococcales bacterium]